VDTSDVDIDEVIDRLESIVRERAGAALRKAHRAQSDGGSLDGSVGGSVVGDGVTAP
jgi:hypothetical protein